VKSLFENWRKFTENIDVDVDVGDVILGGKYKNKRMVVKEIGKDELGQPTVNGKPMLKFRIEKHLPDNKKSKKTLDAEKEKLEEAKVSKSVLKTLRAWPKGWRGGESPGKYYGNFKKSDWTADDKGYIEDKGRGFYILTDLGREILAANPPEEEKVNEQGSGLPPGMEGFGFDVEDEESDPDGDALAALDQGDEFIIGRSKQVYRVINKAKNALIKHVIKIGTKGRNSYMVRRVNPEGYVVAPFKVIRADGTSEKKPAAPAGLITKVGHTEVRDR